MNYDDLLEQQKIELLNKEYKIAKNSFKDIADKVGTYANKLRRDAVKYNIPIRSKSEAQKNALSSGKTKHPTQGKQRSEEVKNKIGRSVMNAWEELDDEDLKKRKLKAKQNWEKLNEDEKEYRLNQANLAVRESSKTGSKLEKHLLNRLLSDGYSVDFHKEQYLLNTKLQIDLFLPDLNIAIEVDGPSHFEPVWGNDALNRNKKYDNKKTGLILGKGLVLIRVAQTRDYSKARADKIYEDLKAKIIEIEKSFPGSDNRLILIGE
jgi:very-short-patch-repair endonuclease